jgi:hypothetical protein
MCGKETVAQGPRGIRAWCILSLLCLLASVSFPPAGHGQDISAAGGWIETIDAGDLVSGAGSDLTDAHVSSTSATAISVIYAGSWRVDVKRTDSFWHSDYTLFSQRTSGGSGSGSIAGGLSYQSISTTDAVFFSGTADRSGIDVQHRLTGMSVNAQPATYSTTVTFTLVSTD